MEIRAARRVLLAWDPVAQKARWSVPLDTIWNGGTLATGGGLVFQGTADGYFSAYDAALGQQLWRFNAGLGTNAAPVTYSIREARLSCRRLWRFGRGVGHERGMEVQRSASQAPDLRVGRERLVTSDARTSELSVKALDDPSLQLNQADVEAGHALFMQCAICHGLNLNSTGSPGPDLRESAIALRLDTLSALLQQGTLLSGGMPRFETLNQEQVRHTDAQHSGRSPQGACHTATAARRDPGRQLRAPGGSAEAAFPAVPTYPPRRCARRARHMQSPAASSLLPPDR